MTEIREWYSVYVFESIEKYSKELKWLTITLIGVTVVLTVLTAWWVWGSFT
jgi:hypothetical protein